MTFLSFIKFISSSSIVLVLLLILVNYAPYLINSSTKSNRTKLLKSFDGPLKDNNLLSESEHLFENQIFGPESLSPYKNKLYTGTHDGKILEIYDNKFEVIYRINNSDTCLRFWDIQKCGRILGNRIDEHGNMYFVEPYSGLYKFNINMKPIRPIKILDINILVENNYMKFLDDIVIDEGNGKNGGNIYYLTDASIKYDLEYVFISVLDQDESGRIIKYDEDSKEITVLLRDLAFPNGIELNDNKTALLICELNKRRILKHYIKGPKTGTTETLIDDLPGEPDNIRRSKNTRETYWLAFTFTRTFSENLFVDILSDKPYLRRAIIRLIYFIGTVTEKIGESISLISLQNLGRELWTFKIYLNFSKLRGSIIEIDSNGSIINALHSPDGFTNWLSEVREVIENNKRTLYLGSYLNSYLGKVVLN